MNKNVRTGLKTPVAGRGQRSRGRRLYAVALAAALAMTMGAACADPVNVPNGDFSAPGNDGTVGGGVLGGSATDVMIGSGPWLGTYWGIVGLLAPPALDIDAGNQTARISGLAGVGIALLNNGGFFTQSLADNYQFGRFYVLSAEVDAGELLTLDLLGDSGVGIGLRAGGSVLASSTTSPAHLLDLDLLAGDNHRLRLGYLADMAASGPINIKLAYEPSGVATVDLLADVTFRNVELEVRDIGVATAVEILSFGDMLQAEVGQPFTGSLVALVRDEDGDGVPGHVVTFTAPASGASATLTSPTGGTGTVVTAVTDIDGLAVVQAQANNEAGCYRVTAEGTGIVDVAEFHLRNYSLDPAADSIFCNGYQ